MVLAYLDHQFKYKSYAKEFSVNHIEQWEEDKRGVMLELRGAFVLDGDPEPIDVPFVIGHLIALPVSALTASLIVSAFSLYYAFYSPWRVIQNRPGFTDELQLKKQLADNWEKKVKAAASLFNCRIEPPSVACKWEFELYQFLINRIPESGCFNFSSQDVQQAASTSSSR